MPKLVYKKNNIGQYPWWVLMQKSLQNMPNQIQQDIKMILHFDVVGFILGIQMVQRIKMDQCNASF